MSFQNFSLHGHIIETLARHGIKEPTPIQALAIPAVLAGRDLQASAQTGTGKTLAFLLPALDRLSKREQDPKESFKESRREPSKAYSRAPLGPKVLILTPTRELAQQVADEAIKFSEGLPRTRTVVLLGGVPYGVQERSLRRPYEILVATPGRLIDWLQRGAISLQEVELLVLDEADRMLDMGFYDDVEHIASSTNPSRQTLLFSATLKGAVVELAHRLLKDPLKLATESAEDAVEKIEQRLHYVDDLHHKQKILAHLLQEGEIGQAIIFTATKSYADALSEDLEEMGFSCASLHGDLNQRQRSRTLERLKEGKIQLLIATDVAARGVHVDQLTHVFNFDLPFRVEDYVHRIGRTGRAGAHGTAITFATAKEAHAVKRIENYTGKTMAIHQIAGLEPRHLPSTRGRSDRGSSGPRYGRSGNSNRGGRSHDHREGGRSWRPNRSR